MGDCGLHSVKTILRSLIVMSPNGITLRQLNIDYREQAGKDIPYPRLGFSRLDMFMRSLNDICEVQTNYSTNITMVYAIQSEASRHISKMVMEQRKPKKSRQRSRNFQANRNHSANKFNGDRFSYRNESNSNEAQRKQTQYNGMSRGPVPAEAAFNSDRSSSATSEQAERLPPASHDRPKTPIPAKHKSPKKNNTQKSHFDAPVQQLTDKIEKMVVTQAATGSKKNRHGGAEAIPYLSDDDDVFQVGLPEEVAKRGTSIAQSVLPANLEKDSLLEIFVSEINNPFRFWFHIQNEDCKLQQIMQQIGDYYTSCFNGELKMSEAQATPGQLCAVLFLGMWHRAEVVQPLDENGDVKVYCIDYGTITWTKLDNLKFLLNEFCTLPSQVYRGCLAFIQPIGHRWKREASYCFLSLVPDAMIYAKVEDIDNEDQVLRLLLIDTNGETDIQINQVLIDKGHAKPMVSTEGPSAPTKRHYCERYPTFEMLENAKYPSLAEIGYMLIKGIDFESMLDENIVPELDVACQNLQFSELMANNSEMASSLNQQLNTSYEQHSQPHSSSITLDKISTGSFESIECISPILCPTTQNSLQHGDRQSSNNQLDVSTSSLDEIISGSCQRTLLSPKHLATELLLPCQAIVNPFSELQRNVEPPSDMIASSQKKNIVNAPQDTSVDRLLCLEFDNYSTNPQRVLRPILMVDSPLVDIASPSEEAIANELQVTIVDPLPMGPVISPSTDAGAWPPKCAIESPIQTISSSCLLTEPVTSQVTQNNAEITSFESLQFPQNPDSNARTHTLKPRWRAGIDSCNTLRKPSTEFERLWVSSPISDVNTSPAPAPAMSAFPRSPKLCERVNPPRSIQDRVQPLLQSNRLLPTNHSQPHQPYHYDHYDTTRTLYHHDRYNQAQFLSHYAPAFYSNVLPPGSHLPPLPDRPMRFMPNGIQEPYYAYGNNQQRLNCMNHNLQQPKFQKQSKFNFFFRT